MNFSIIGSGNIAHFIGSSCLEAGNTIDEVISTNEKTGQELARKLKATFLNDYSQSSASTFLLAIPDDAIIDFSRKIPFKNRLVVHTSGSVRMEKLSENNRKGVFYPLQTFTSNAKVNFSEISYDNSP